MDARRCTTICTRWWVVVLVMLSTRLSGLLAWYCSAGDRATLLEFKSGFVDVGGVFSTWDENSNCCTWRGVRCAESTGAVLELTILGSSGSQNKQSYRDTRYNNVGAGLVALTSLEQLTIQWLLLNEPLPSEWGMFSGNLKVIVINNCNLQGDIPPSLASIPNLQTLDLRSNHLTGAIPPEFCKQKSIKYIDVSYNNMNYLLVPSCLLNRGVTVVYGNQGQNQGGGPGCPQCGPPGGHPGWSAGSQVSVPSMAFTAISGGALLVWTLL